MLIDRPNIVEGTFIKNATVPSGLLAPADPSEGELFVFEDDTVTGSAGLHVFLGGWEIVPAGISIEDVDTHIADTALHLSTAQNTLLDGLVPSLTFTELNYVDGVTSPIQDQFGAQTTALADHIADPDLHLSTAQNTLLDGLAPTLTAAELNYVDGVTSPIQDQIDTAVADANTHIADVNLHLSANQNTFVDSLDFVAETPAQKAASVNALSAHLTNVNLHLSTAQNTFLDALNLPSLTAADVNRASGLDAYLTSAGQSNLSVALASKLSRSGDTMGSGANLAFSGGGTVTGLPFPISDTDAANKAYVDAMGSGIDWKEPVVAASTGPLALSGAPTLVDDVVINAGDRVLVKDQADPAQNGIYLAAAGPWSRAPDYDDEIKISQSAVYVLDSGTASGGGSYIQPAIIVTFPSDPINFFPFTGPVINTAGNGINVGVGGLVEVKEARGITFDGGGNVEADIFPGHLIFTTDGATVSSAPGAQIGLASTGIAAGTYRSITVDTKGRATAGTNPTTLAGYGITDAQPLAANLTGLAAVATLGISVRTAVGIWTSRSIASTDLTLTNADGVAGNPTINLPSVGTPGTYRSVTTDSKGRVTAGTNPTTLAGYGITDAQPLNARLTSVAALATDGIVVNSGSTALARQIAVSGTGLTITNGDGVAGNPTITSNATSSDVASTIVARDADGSFSTNEVSTFTVKGRVASITVTETGAFRGGTGGLGAQVIDIWPLAEFRTAKYVYHMETALGQYQAGEVLVMHNGTSVFITEYAVVGNNVGAFSASIVGADVFVSVTPTSGSSNTITGLRTLINAT